MCKCYRYPSEYLKEGRMLKTCNKCRESNSTYRTKNQCPHKRQKRQCRECGGKAYCVHDKIKWQCRECGGKAYCVHDKIKEYCRECKDPIKLIINQWIFNCRRSDKTYKRFDADNFIDRDFLTGLIEDYKSCYYDDCRVKFEYIGFVNNLVTIERLNNMIGHDKSNCVLCCMKCNWKKKANDIKSKIPL